MVLDGGTALLVPLRLLLQVAYRLEPVATISLLAYTSLPCIKSKSLVRQQRFTSLPLPVAAGSVFLHLPISQQQPISLLVSRLETQGLGTDADLAVAADCFRMRASVSGNDKSACLRFLPPAALYFHNCIRQFAANLPLSILAGCRCIQTYFSGNNQPACLQPLPQAASQCC